MVLLVVPVPIVPKLLLFGFIILHNIIRVFYLPIPVVKVAAVAAKTEKVNTRTKVEVDSILLDFLAVLPKIGKV